MKGESTEVEMNVSVVDLNENQKKVLVQLPADKVQRELDKKYREVSKSIRIRGFRQGKAPRNLIKSLYGKTIESELSSQFIQETFPDALTDSALKPLAEADVSELKFEDDGSFTYTAIVDVCPEFELAPYKGIEVAMPPTEVTDEMVDAEIDRMREQHAQLKTIDPPRPVVQGDVLVVDFTPSVDGHVLEKGKSTDFMLEVGKGSVHPDFDGNLLGHELGESFSFEIVYPDNAPTREVAGKHVQMDVTIKELKEKILPEANDDFAKEVDSDTFDALRQATRERLAARLEERRTGDIRNQIVDQLVKSTTFTLTDKVLDQEVQRMVDQLVQQFQSQGLSIDPARFNTPEIRESYKPQAEANVKRRLILMKIAEVEGIELTDEEREQVYEEYAKILRIDVEELKEKYSGVGFIEQALDYKMDEKIMKLLEESAIIKDGPRDPEGAENQE